MYSRQHVETKTQLSKELSNEVFIDTLYLFRNGDFTLKNDWEKTTTWAPERDSSNSLDVEETYNYKITKRRASRTWQLNDHYDARLFANGFGHRKQLRIRFELPKVAAIQTFSAPTLKDRKEALARLNLLLAESIHEELRIEDFSIGRVDLARQFPKSDTSVDFRSIFEALPRTRGRYLVAANESWVYRNKSWQVGLYNKSEQAKLRSKYYAHDIMRLEARLCRHKQVNKHLGIRTLGELLDMDNEVLTEVYGRFLCEVAFTDTLRERLLQEHRVAAEIPTFSNSNELWEYYGALNISQSLASGEDLKTFFRKRLPSQSARNHKRLEQTFEKVLKKIPRELYGEETTEYKSEKAFRSLKPLIPYIQTGEFAGLAVTYRGPDQVHPDIIRALESITNSPINWN